MLNGAAINRRAINGASPTYESAYQAWLRDDVQPIVHLIDIEYVGGLEVGTYNPVVYLLKVSDAPYPPYYDVVKSIPSFTRQIGEGFTGAVTSSIGSLEVDITDGSRDAWLRLLVDGGHCRIRHGHPDWDISRFRIIQECRVEAPAQADLNTLTFRLRAAESDANNALQTNVIAAGPNADKLIPLSYGNVFNVEPMLAHASSPIYQWHDGQVQEVTSVRDSGYDFQTSAKTISAVDTGTETITFSAAHGAYENSRARFTGTPPAPLSAGTDYWVIADGLTTTDLKVAASLGGTAINLTGTETGATCVFYHWTATNSTGKITLDSTPAGQITLDGKGYVGADGYIDDPSSILIEILDSPNVDARWRAKFDAIAQEIGWHVRERENRLTVAEEIAEGLSAWFGHSRKGLLRFGRVRSSRLAGIKILESDIVQDSLKLERVIVPFFMQSIRYYPNWTVQTTGLAAGVTDANRAYYGDAYRNGPGVAYLEPWAANYHRKLIYADAKATPLMDSTQAENEILRVGAMFASAGQWNLVFSCELGRIGYAVDIGDKITVEHSRLNAGANSWVHSNQTTADVIKVEDRPSNGTVAIEFLMYGSNYLPGQL